MRFTGRTPAAVERSASELSRAAISTPRTSLASSIVRVTSACYGRSCSATSAALAARTPILNKILAIIGDGQPRMDSLDDHRDSMR
jgi:hypothetical protein